MKNQYVGDVGDYGKYALLRFLLNKGIRLGINWYLTPDIEGNKDGNKRDYLDKSIYEEIDSGFLKMMRRLQDDADRKVSRVKELGILEGAVFYDRILDTSDKNKWDKTMFRKQWHRSAQEALEDCQLIFADPDNGLSPDSDDKFIMPDEIEDYFTTWGHDIVYYHHRDRSSQSDWLDTISFMGKYLPQARIIALTFHPYEQRAYIFVLHEKTYEKYAKLIDEFLATNWGTIPVTSKKEPVFEKVVFEKKNDSGLPCICFMISDPNEAYQHMSLKTVISYGSTLNGKRLHTWDRGERMLCQCMNCGGYVLVQESEYHQYDNDDDYDDYFPVTGENQADELNRKYDGFGIEREFGLRYLQKTNGELSWRN